MNSLVAYHRQQVPNDPRSDDELTLAIGDNYPGVYDQQYPDFAQDYAALKNARDELNKPSIGQEVGRGVKRGTSSLVATLEAAGALGAGAVHEDDLREALLNRAQQNEQDAAENAPTVAGVQDIKSGSDVARYLLGQAGEIAPNVAETAVTATVGALGGGVVGTAAEPGAGTVAGAGTGLLAGIFEKQAVKALLKKFAEDGVKDAAEAAAETELKSLAKGVAEKGISEGTQALIGDATKQLARKYGGEAANLLNFYAQSAGGLYSKLSQDKNVDPDTALNVSLYGGLASAVPATFLPNYIVGQVFNTEVRNEVKDASKNAFYQYFTRLASESAKTVPGGAASMSLAELANIAAEKYADPVKRDTPLSDDDVKRLVNASVTGGLMGLFTSPVAAMGGKEKPTVSKELSGYTGDLPEKQQDELTELAKREVKGDLSVTEQQTVDNLTPEQKNFYTVAKAQVGSELPNYTDHMAALTDLIGKDGAKTIKQDEEDFLRRLDEHKSETPTPQPAPVEPQPVEQPVEAPVDPTVQPQPEPAPVQAAAEPVAPTRDLSAFRNAAVPESEIGRETPAPQEPKEIQLTEPVKQVPAPETFNTADELLKFRQQRFDEEVRLYQQQIGLSKPQAETLQKILHRDGSTSAFEKTLNPEQRSRLEWFFEESPYNQKGGPFEFWNTDKQFNPEDVAAESDKSALASTLVRVVDKGVNLNLTDDRFLTAAIAAKRLEELGGSKSDIARALDKWTTSNSGSQGDKAEYFKILGKKIVSFLDSQGVSLDDGDIRQGREPDLAQKLAEVAGVQDVKAVADKVKSNAVAPDEAVRDQLAKEQEQRDIAATVQHDKARQFLAQVGFDSQNLVEGTTRRGTSKGKSGVKTELPPVNDRIRIVIGGEHEGEAGEVVSEPRKLVIDNQETSDRYVQLKLRNGDTVDVRESDLEPLTKVQRRAKVEAESESPERPAKEAYFEVPADTYLEAGGKVNPDKLNRLGDDLTSRSAPPSNAKNTDTHRATAFETPEGKVVVLPTYETNAKERGGKVYRVAPVPGESKGGKLESLLERGFKPLSSFYLENTVNALDPKASIEFASRQDFEQHLAQPARDRILAAKRTAEAVASKMATSYGATEHVETGETIEPAEQGATTGPATKLEFSDELAGQIHEDLDSLLEGKPSDPEDAESVLSEIANTSAEHETEIRNLIQHLIDEGYSYTDAAKTLVERIAGAYNNDSTSEGFIKALQGSEHLPGQAAADAGGKTAVHQSAADAKSANNISTEKGAARQQGQEGQGGNAVADRPAAEVRFSIPKDSQPSQEGFYRQSFDTIARRLTDAGVPVQVVGTLIHDTFNGVYDKAAKAITLAVRDTANPTAEDFRALIEESGHHLFADLPADEQARLQTAISRLTDTDLGIGSYTRSNDAGIQAEERLMAAVSQNLVNNGFDPIKADTFAGRIVRFLKDLYFKSAMAIQTALFGDAFNNPDLARRYFQNRLESFLSGDGSSQWFLDILGGGKPSVPKEATWRSNRPLFEQLTADGRIQYDHVPDTDLAASRFNLNNLRFSTPGDRPTRRVEIEKRAAVLNHQFDLIDESAKQPEIDALAKAAKADPHEFLMKTLGLSDPRQALQELNTALETDGSPVGFDANRRIDDFKGKANKDAATTQAYRNAVALQSKIARIKVNAEETLTELRSKREKALQRYDEDKNRYADWEHSAITAQRAIQREARRLFNAVSGTSKRMGAVEQLLKQIDPLATIKDYAPAFQKLFTGGELKGEKLYNILEKAALDESIDFRKPIRDIRSAMAGKPEFAPLLQNTKESRALLASVVAFAKTHEKTMLNIELRREKNGQRRVEIARQADELKAQRADLAQSIRDLNRTSKLEERYRAAHADSLRSIREINNRIRRAETKSKVADAAAPIFTRAINELSGKLDLGANATWGHGMAYNVPENPNATNTDVINSRKTIALDSSSKVTNPLDVESDLRKMEAFLAHREALAASGNADALDNVYQGVKRQWQEIQLHKNFTPKVGPASKFLTELNVLPVGKKIADAFGTPAARLIDQLVNKFTSEKLRMTPEAERIGRKNDQLEDGLLKFLPSKMADKREYLRANFLNPAKRMMQMQHDLEEIYADQPEKLKNAIYNRVRTMLLSNEATRPYVKGNEAEFMTGLRKLLEFQHESNKYLLDQVEKAGTGVLDTSLKALNPATGKMEAGIRRHVERGAYTFSQTLSQNFRVMVNAMRNSGWALAGSDFSHIAELYNAGRTDELHALVDKYFTHPEHGEQVQNDFFGALAQMDTESVFDRPDKGDGLRTPADIEKVLQAYDASKGDVLSFAELLHKLHGGQEDVGGYVQNTLMKLAEVYNEADRMMEKIEPRSDGERTIGIEGMTSPALINARSIEHLPGQWFDYHSFDQRDMFRMIERIASQTAFGRDQSRLAEAFKTVISETNAARQKLAVATAKARRELPQGDAKAVEARVKTILGADEYKRVKQFSERSRLATDSIRDLSTYFRRDNNPDGTVKLMTRMSQSLGNLMVNQPSSAIAQLAALYDLNLKYGASRSALGATVKTLGAAGKEIAASLAQAVGVQMFNDGYYHRKFVELGLSDASAVKKFSDAFDRLQGEGRMAHLFRGANDLLGAGLNRLGDKAEHTVLRPLQPFITSAVATNKALTEGIWHLASQHVMRGVEYYRNHTDQLHDPNFKLTREALGLKGLEKDSFTRLTQDFDRWGLNYDEMVRNAVDRSRQGDNSPLTNDQMARLYSMMLSEVSSESNLSTMPLAAYNNSLVRFALPLVGWSFRRMNTIAQLRLNEEGKNDLKALARGMAGLAVISAGGLATSGLVNLYYNNVVGKQRNLRPASDVTDPMAVLENLNRIGTLGMFGELANSLVNVGQGGDNRALSVDGRLLAFNSLQSIMQATSSWINQDFNPDYVHVVRPLASAVGGGGLLQYMQIANKALGLDNMESRVTARINAQNYLRVVGREIGLEVRQSDGGVSTPTPLTPYLTQMELAAYGNNPGDFQAAFNAAVETAKDLGFDDPVDHVKKAYAGRNPLKNIFRTPPTETDFQKILANLDGDGRQDVSEAVRLFNYYGQFIGVKPWDGRTEKPSAPTPKATLSDFRARAISGNSLFSY